mmetsp:Transcript_3926/g.7112  ORF Transcript_3926/g.7112 Transcript_3926/m.7112 type:complete len:283 (-) Transcript_3926:1882-2730(-)
MFMRAISTTKKTIRSQPKTRINPTATQPIIPQIPSSPTLASLCHNTQTLTSYETRPPPSMTLHWGGQIVGQNGWYVNRGTVLGGALAAARHNGRHLLLQLPQQVLSVALEARLPRFAVQVIHHPQLRVDAVDQARVVTHQHHPAVVSIQSIAQRIDRLDVQVVSGLIQHEDVRRHQAQLHEHYSRLLTATQVSDGDGVGVPLEAVAPQDVPGRLVRLVVKLSTNERDGVLVHGQPVHEVLVVDAHAQPGIPAHLPHCGLNLLRDELDQGTLPAAVRTNNAHS